MGFFSADCKGCGHPLLSLIASNEVNIWMNLGVIITVDGEIFVGSYDGYGQLWCDDEEQIPEGEWSVMGIGSPSGPTVWHEACWKVAGYPTDYQGPSEAAADQGWFFERGAHDLPEPQGGEDKGRNPFGKCDNGHLFFRGGCGECFADMSLANEAKDKGLIP